MGPRTRIVSVLLVAAFLVAVAPGSVAAAGDCTTGEVAHSDVEAFVAGYNDSTDRLPGLLRDRLADERVAVDVGGVNATYTLHTNGSAHVTTVENGSVDPTLRVTTTASVVCNATASDDPAGAMLAAYDRGDVDVEGVGIVRGAAVTVGKAAYGVGSALGIW
ncbi:hypothetical protein J2752_002144 [Halarchaeum rubridurum]|uniref:Uncharacterized protein n=1 Tax=Halarchaeum rubridurum TaxID=489911 RepID=A0A830FZJ5_9EURY|nr:hypothetical protein [Halarchaeum rubridurum]MBP1955232.1 hypothetical protein [Halarchaeum rubridurum]GGM67948.1 hypothetical protein GCM10009017_17640 [Halarchaeum rubridurum]